MPRIFYTPPPGTPPLDFEYSGTRVFMPPDQYWKRAREPYVVETLWDEQRNEPKKDRRTGKPMEVKQTIKVWVVDEEANALFRDGHIGAPKNFLDLTDDEYQVLMRGADKNPIVEGTSGEMTDKKRFLVSESAMVGQHERTMRELQERFDLEEVKLKRTREARLRKLRLEAEAAERGPGAKPYPDDDAPPAAAVRAPTVGDLASPTSKRK